jgi:hypothetical protein
MRIVKRNMYGESVYSVIVELEEINLGEFGGDEGDYAELWSVEYGEMPIHNDDQVHSLTKAIESKLNPEGNEGAIPVKEELVEDIVLETVDSFLANLS